MINEAKREEVRKEAKQILQKFAKSLESVKLKEKKRKNGAGGFREEGIGAEENADFRKRMFDNAPNKDEECIIAEKKEW
ncbi:MAG: NopRA1 domain-containing protein [archaeon]|nr:NopRA1 domain-containing protein [archaeon]